MFEADILDILSNEFKLFSALHPHNRYSFCQFLVLGNVDYTLLEQLA